MGDDTAEELGFLTLNPLNHIDMVGLVVLFLFSDTIRMVFSGLFGGRSVPIYVGFGWGRQVPVDVSRIHGRYRWIKVAMVLFSDVKTSAKSFCCLLSRSAMYLLINLEKFRASLR